MDKGFRQQGTDFLFFPALHSFAPDAILFLKIYLKAGQHHLSFGTMTAFEFTYLDETKQAETLLERGIFLTERLYKNFTIFLYQIDNFYVEVYHNIWFNTLQGMRSFEDDETLQPYLESIDISCLYE